MWDSFYEKRNCPHVMIKAPFMADCSQLAELEATLQAWAYQEQLKWDDGAEPTMTVRGVALPLVAPP